jgi:hypothetical protein
VPLPAAVHRDEQKKRDGKGSLGWPSCPSPAVDWDAIAYDNTGAVGPGEDRHARRQFSKIGGRAFLNVERAEVAASRRDLSKRTSAWREFALGLASRGP